MPRRAADACFTTPPLMFSPGGDAAALLLFICLPRHADIAVVVRDGHAVSFSMMIYALRQLDDCLFVLFDCHACLICLHLLPDFLFFFIPYTQHYAEPSSPLSFWR